MIDLQVLVDDYAVGLFTADARRPMAVNQRSGRPFRPGIGPHTEDQTVELALAEMRTAHPVRYGNAKRDVQYPDKSSQKCDLAIISGGDALYIELKLLRFLGDNGRPNDNMLMHILSPYPKHRSALTDFEKLRRSRFEGRKAVLIFGYESKDWPLAPTINAFEVLAREQGSIGPCHSATFSGLCHPVHSAGQVFVWELR